MEYALIFGALAAVFTPVFIFIQNKREEEMKNAQKIRIRVKSRK